MRPVQPEKALTLLGWASRLLGINAAILLYALTRLGVILAGVSEAERGTLESVAAKLAYGLKVEVLHTGTITTLSLGLINTGGAGTLGLVKPVTSESATPGKGEILASGAATVEAEGAEKKATLGGLSVKVTKGEILWLVFYPTEAAKFLRPSGETTNPTSVTTSKVASLTLAVAETGTGWSSTKHGFSKFLAEGTEEGGESFSGTATVRSGVRMTSTGAKGAAGAAVVKGASAATASGAKGASGSPGMLSAVAQAAAGQKRGAGEATVRAASGQTASGQKTGAGEGRIRPASAQTASGQKTGTGEGRIRPGARTVAAGAKSTAGQAVLRSATVLTAVTSELVFSGIGVLRAAARAVATGAKETGGASATHTATRTTSAASKFAGGTGVLRIATRLLQAVQAAKALGLPGRVNPSSRRANANPSSRRGRTNPSQKRGRDA